MKPKKQTRFPIRLGIVEDTTPVDIPERVACIYAKSDNKVYFLDGAGSEHCIGSLDQTQTFTNKTLTSPVLTNPTNGSSVPTIGADIITATAPSYWMPFGKKGTAGMKVTEFYIDLTGLSSVADDGDVIGDTGETSGASLGQYTTAIFGTLAAIEMICLEAPTGGTPDIDLYSVNDAALYIDEDASGGDQLIAAGGNWTNGMVKGATALPTATHYFYLTAGAAAAGDYTTGKFIIRFYGV